MRIVTTIAALAAIAVTAVCGAQPRALAVANKTWTGDFDKMLERRMIRVYAPYSRSLYFNDKGRERGLSAELVRDFERWLNQKYAKELGKRPLTVYIVPATRDKLIPDVMDGLADIAVGNLTVTPERERFVDFVSPISVKPVDEVVVTGPTAAPIASLDDLAGRKVHVRPASSYHESLVAQSKRLEAAGKPAIDLVLVPDALEDEDMLEMMNTGLIETMVVDDWKARMWSQVLPRVTVHYDLVLRDNARVGWVIRKESPKLAAEIEDFHKSWASKQGVIDYRLAQYMKRVKELKDPTGSAEWKRFQDTLSLFEKYGQRYGFDPLMLAAQGYQESTLDQNAKSHVGAIGVMQIMPATGQQLGVGDIREIEPNIHGGAKYMDQLMAKYFPDASFSAGNRPLFAFASYNAGPGNIARMRKEAAKRGLDPDKWFNNVEVVTAEKIGIETTTYVRNIYKYYVAYKLMTEARDAAEQAKKQVVR
ncbi:MAG: transporter substrate-binding domain-containing protein [Burkholderiales bacterium]